MFLFHIVYKVSEGYVLLVMCFIDDREECKVIDCSIEDSVSICPNTCKDAAELSKICARADCTKHESIHMCPRQCGAGKEHYHGENMSGTQKNILERCRSIIQINFP